jgi:fimbrial chaperone protein
LRVQYVGNNVPKAELAYRLIADQLPVDLGGAPASGGQLRLLVRYVASVYVTAPGAKPEVAVEAASPQGVANASKLAVDLVNRGTQHMILRNMTLRLTGQKTGGGEVSIDLDDARLEGLVTENLLAGAKRRFLLPWPSELAPGPVHATLSLKTR